MTTLLDTALVTKLFTTAGIVLLENCGVLGFHDKIHSIIDLVGTKIPIDVEKWYLLTHTSGIANNADEENGEDYAALFNSFPLIRIRENIDFYQISHIKSQTLKLFHNLCVCAVKSGTVSIGSIQIQ